MAAPTITREVVKRAPRVASARTATPRAAKAKPADLRWQAEMLKNASDPTRLGVIMLLVDRELNVGEICTHFGQSQPAVSHHLALLRHARIIESRREGKHNIYGLMDMGRKLAAAVGSLQP